MSGIVNLVDSQIASRVCRFLDVPFYLVHDPLHALVGTIASVGSLVTLGTSQTLNRYVTDTLWGWKKVIPNVYLNVVRTIHPNLPIAKQEDEDSVVFSCVELVRFDIEAYKKSDNLFVRHVVTRLSCALQGIALVIARIVDFPIGLVAAALSLVTLGMFQSLNDLAYKNLQVGGIVADVLEYGVKTVNPWSTINEPYKG